MCNIFTKTKLGAIYNFLKFKKLKGALVIYIENK